MFVLLAVLSTAMVITFLSYVTLIFVPFLTRTAREPGNEDAFDWHFFVPCRDESAVIANTMQRLRETFPSAHVWVIDDDSDDDTGAIVAERARTDEHVHLVSRVLPEARTGKGDALNSAYDQLIAWLPADADHARTIVCVVDADGEMAANALEQAAGDYAFGDTLVGGAQATVKMKNRNDGVPAASGFGGRVSQFLVRMQDLEFRTIIVGMQSLRAATGTVGLGGNGQFTRLTVLDEIRDIYGAPWHGSLLEDYELGVHVLLAGHQIRHLHDTYVEQEGLRDVRRFLTQRTRWAQGNIQCVRYLRQVVASPHFDSSGVVESAYYLLLPFIQLLGMLTWTTLFVTVVVRSTTYDGGVLAMISDNAWLLFVVVLFGVAPFAIWGPAYQAKCEPGGTLWRGVGWGLGAWIYSLYTWATTPRAFSRVLLRRSGWAKTRRNAEQSVAGEAVAKER